VAPYDWQNAVGEKTSEGAKFLYVAVTSYSKFLQVRIGDTLKGSKSLREDHDVQKDIIRHTLHVPKVEEPFLKRL
jgi:hypothetical protein